MLNDDIFAIPIVKLFLTYLDFMTLLSNTLRLSAAIFAVSLISVTPSHAAGAGGFDVMSLLPIVLIFAVFYFMLLRPQQQKMKKHQELLSKLKRGDSVVTSGGIIGTVQKTTDTEVQLEIDKGVRINVVKSMITEVRHEIEKDIAKKPGLGDEKLGERVKNKNTKKAIKKGELASSQVIDLSPSDVSDVSETDTSTPENSK